MGLAAPSPEDTERPPRRAFRPEHLGELRDLAARSGLPLHMVARIGDVDPTGFEPASLGWQARACYQLHHGPAASRAIGLTRCEKARRSNVTEDAPFVATSCQFRHKVVTISASDPFTRRGRVSSSHSVAKTRNARRSGRSSPGDSNARSMRAPRLAVSHRSVETGNAWWCSRTMSAVPSSRRRSGVRADPPSDAEGDERRFESFRARFMPTNRGVGLTFPKCGFARLITSRFAWRYQGWL